MRETIFPETHEYVQPKMLGEKSSQKFSKKRFLYSLEYRHQKMVGKNARNNFSRNTRMVRAKMLEKNRCQKVQKTFFYIHTNIVSKKVGGKTHAIIFPETHE